MMHGIELIEGKKKNKKLEQKGEKTMKKSKAKALSLVIVLFFMVSFLARPYSANAKCCPVVSVSNWGELASLMQTTIVNVFVNTIIPHLIKIWKEEMLKVKTTPGVLKDVDIEKLAQDMDNVHYEAYINMQNIYSSLIKEKSSKAWYCTILFFLDKCKNINNISGISPDAAVLRMFTWNDIDSKKFDRTIAEYAYALKGDMSYVEEYYNKLKDLSDVSDDYKNAIGLAVGELKAAKDQLVVHFLDNAAKLKVLNEYRKKVEEYDKRINEAAGAQGYVTDAVIKDLLKIQMLQGLILTELYEVRIKEQMMDALLANLKLNKIRRDLVGEMHNVVNFQKIK